MMKKIVLTVLVILSLVFSVSAMEKGGFTKKASGKPEIIQKGPDKMWCPVCGMNLKMFYKTSHGVHLHDGSAKQYCSIRCLITDMDNIKDAVKQIVVVDAKAEKLIDAKTAHYVMGSKIPGTMTKVSKFAFADKKNALAFQKMFGGELVTFTKAYESAENTMKKDVAMTDKKRAKMMYPMGKKVFAKMCIPDIDPTRYDRINELKGDITKNKLCKPMKEKQLQAVALYLWDIVRNNKKPEVKNAIEVPEKAKCPVCGMFVYKYPKWAAVVEYKTGQTTSKFFFDGSKDMFKFIYDSAKYGFKGKLDVKDIQVTDYYSQKAIDGKKAFYVAGSDTLGPMGHEFIPFETMELAKTFSKDHGGKKILKFEEIDINLINSIDGTY